MNHILPEAGYRPHSTVASEGCSEAPKLVYTHIVQPRKTNGQLVKNNIWWKDKATDGASTRGEFSAATACGRRHEQQLWEKQRGRDRAKLGDTEGGLNERCTEKDRCRAAKAHRAWPMLPGSVNHRGPTGCVGGKGWVKNTPLGVFQTS